MLSALLEMYPFTFLIHAIRDDFFMVPVSYFDERSKSGRNTRARNLMDTHTEGCACLLLAKS